MQCVLPCYDGTAEEVLRHSFIHWQERYLVHSWRFINTYFMESLLAHETTRIIHTLSFWARKKPACAMCACMPSHFSCVRLFVTLWIAARQAPLCMGRSWQEYGSGSPCPLPGDLPHPGMKLRLLHILRYRQILYRWSHWGSPPPPTLIPWLFAKSPVLCNDNTQDTSNLFSASNILSTLLDLCWHYYCSSLKPGFKTEVPLSRLFTCISGKFGWLLYKGLCSSCWASPWSYLSGLTVWLLAVLRESDLRVIETGAAVFVMSSTECHALLLP